MSKRVIHYITLASSSAGWSSSRRRLPDVPRPRSTKPRNENMRPSLNNCFSCKRSCFAIPQLAQEALAVVGKKWKYYHMGSSQLIEHKRYATKGRPPQDPSPSDYVAAPYPCETRCRTPPGRHKRYHVCFVLGSNIEAEQLSDAEVIAGYQGQAQAEGGFRFLKDPVFFVSVLFMKNPRVCRGC
jgi:hypothetical protein